MSVTDRQDPYWGTLKIGDPTRLADRLAESTAALYAASQAAMYRTATDIPIESPLAMLLGGLTQVVDALIDQMNAEAEAAGSAS